MTIAVLESLHCWSEAQYEQLVCWLIILPEMKMKYRWLLLITPVFMADAYGEIDATAFKLKRISDGDTLVSTEDTRIRLWGIDTPERDQPYGDSATGALANMLDNQKLFLKTKDVDRYGREVAVIYNADGSKVSCFINDANRSQARQQEENHHFKTSAGCEKRCEYAVSVCTNNKLPSESVLLSPKTLYSHQVIRIEESKGEDLCRVIHRAATLDTTRGDNNISVGNATNNTNWTSQKPSLSVNDINMMVKSIASNLRTLHQQGRAHMDLKLANVVINKNAEVSVIDYPDYSQMTINRRTTPSFCGLQRQHVMLSSYYNLVGAGVQITLEPFKKKILALRLDLKPESIEKFRAIRQDFNSVVKDATVSPNDTFHDTWSALYMALSCYAVVNCPRESKVAVQKTFDMMVRMLEDCVIAHKKIPPPTILDNSLFTVQGLHRMRMTESKVRARAEMNRLWGMESTISSLVHSIENELSHSQGMSPARPHQDQATMRATHNSCGQRPWVSRMFEAVWPMPTPIRA